MGRWYSTVVAKGTTRLGRGVVMNTKENVKTFNRLLMSV